MKNNNLDVNKIFSSSFSNLTSQIVPIIANTLIVCVASLILSITLVGIILVPAVWGGYIQSIINVSRGEKISIGQFLGSRFNKWGTLLGATLLYGLGVGLGFICLILPGIYLMIRWSFIFHLIVDKDKGISDAFSISGAMVSERFWDVCVIIILTLIIGGFASVIPFLALVTIPFNSLVVSYYYNQIVQNSNHIKQSELISNEK